MAAAPRGIPEDNGTELAIPRAPVDRAAPPREIPDDSGSELAKP